MTLVYFMREKDERERWTKSHCDFPALMLAGSDLYMFGTVLIE